jgi:hypothetical protein
MARMWDMYFLNFHKTRKNCKYIQSCQTDVWMVLGQLDPAGSGNAVAALFRLV